ncbi:hypothetical protein I5I01_gp83 [Mycobacterium phage MooMoo]|uniref:Uncharacterized protein n=1 Tax=Mycobacterium phage MooMoo TaxID=2108127 RepID=A0A2P1JRA5_9CAUD|nr:hypothetical protein I5I01_gp83 [Mycobacterium phage MooMoo]AVO21688.1 hypothetical protein SEA_MOOMOO_83 [Mycobacterium phage MooMoo]
MSTPERDALITKVREALEEELQRQRIAGELRISVGNRRHGSIDLNTTALANAAFDVLIDAWSPPF